MPTLSNLSKKTVNSLSASYFVGYDPFDTTQTLSGTTVTWPSSAMNTYVWSNSATYGINKINPLFTTVNSNSATWNSETPISNPNVYYVRTNGSNTTGDGSINKPWLSVQYAYDTVNKANPYVINLGMGNFNLALVSPFDDKCQFVGQGAKRFDHNFTTLTINAAITTVTNDANGPAGFDVYLQASNINLVINASGGDILVSDGGTYAAGSGGLVSVIANNVTVEVLSSGGTPNIVDGVGNGGDGGSITVYGGKIITSLSAPKTNGVSGGSNGNSGAIYLDNCDSRDISIPSEDNRITMGRCSYTAGLITITDDRGGNASY